MRVRWTPHAILFTAWMLFVLTAYPGYVDIWGANMLVDSRAGWYSGAQSPSMTLVWGGMEWFIAGPAGMFLLQGTTLLLCSFHALRGRLTDRAAALLAAAILIFPPVLATSSVVCVDAQHATFLMLGLVGICSARRPSQIAGVAALLVAACVRPLGAAATFPLLAFAFPLQFPKRWMQPFAALAVSLTLGIAACGVNAMLVDGDYTTEVRTDRVTGFEQTLGLAPAHGWRTTYTRFVPDQGTGEVIWFTATHSRVQVILERLVRASGKTRLFAPYVYFLLAVLLTGFLTLRRDGLAAALAASGVAHELALFWTDGPPRFDHSHWMVVSALLALALSVRRFRRTDAVLAEQLDRLPPSESPARASAA